MKRLSKLEGIDIEVSSTPSPISYTRQDFDRLVPRVRWSDADLKAYRHAAGMIGAACMYYGRRCPTWSQLGECLLGKRRPPKRLADDLGSLQDEIQEVSTQFARPFGRPADFDIRALIGRVAICATACKAHGLLDNGLYLLGMLQGALILSRQTAGLDLPLSDRDSNWILLTLPLSMATIIRPKRVPSIIHLLAAAPPDDHDPLPCFRRARAGLAVAVGPILGEEERELIGEIIGRYVQQAERNGDYDIVSSYDEHLARVSFAMPPQPAIMQNVEAA